MPDIEDEIDVWNLPPYDGSPVSVRFSSSAVETEDGWTPEPGYLLSDRLAAALAWLGSAEWLLLETRLRVAVKSIVRPRLAAEETGSGGVLKALSGAVPESVFGIPVEVLPTKPFGSFWDRAATAFEISCLARLRFSGLADAFDALSPYGRDTNWSKAAPDDTSYLVFGPDGSGVGVGNVGWDQTDGATEGNSDPKFLLQRVLSPDVMKRFKTEFFREDSPFGDALQRYGLEMDPDED